MDYRRSAMGDLDDRAEVPEDEGEWVSITSQYTGAFTLIDLIRYEV